MTNTTDVTLDRVTEYEAGFRDLVPPTLQLQECIVKMSAAKMRLIMAAHPDMGPDEATHRAERSIASLLIQMAASRMSASDKFETCGSAGIIDQLIADREHVAA